MSTGTMTSKGQITVPKDVREALGLTPGTKVDFRLEGGQWILSAEQLRASDLGGSLRAARSLSLDDMEQVIGKAASDAL